MMLTSGGDERLWLDGATGRNKYGVPAKPAADEVWFSSSTASAISARGWDAAGAALDRLLTSSFGGPSLQDEIRDQLAALYGVAGGAVVLAGSGTETELLLVALAAGDGAQPLTNILVAPAETGRGVAHAAAGRHFHGHTPLGGAVAPGQRLAGWDGLNLLVETVAIRKACGSLRHSEAVDREAYEHCDRATARGHRVILHMLDASKTGRPGVSRAAARMIVETFGDQVLVVVDACQLRCSAQTIRDDLNEGRAVMITGSKFAGGPPFSGALLLPRSMAGRAKAAAALVKGLRPYSSPSDWPAALGVSPGPGLANLGLGLRWTAALAEIRAFHRVSDGLKIWFREAFDEAIAHALGARPWLARLDEGPAADQGNLIPVIDQGCDAKTLHQALGRAGFHLGQPVSVGDQQALRICSSMPMISDFAARVATDVTPATAFKPVAADLTRLFAGWDLARAI